MINNFGWYANSYTPCYGVNYTPYVTMPQNINVSNPIVQLEPVEVEAPVCSEFVINGVSTRLTEAESEKYNKLNELFLKSDENISKDDNVLRTKKLDELLKNGTLLNKNSNDNTSILDNLYETATTERLEGLDGLKTAGDIIDTIYNPAIITQRFGDIPDKEFLSDKPKEYQKEAISINKTGSGTCVAASVEFHMANKHPAEYARWANSLTSPKMSVDKTVDLSSLPSGEEAPIYLLSDYNITPKNVTPTTATIELKPDENAINRVQIQSKHWDKGERRPIDVLFQSTLMQLASKQTYDSLIDIRSGNSNPKGLLETEKTFIESVVENAKRTSVVYQNVDNEQNLLGWNCPLSVIQKHITDTIDSGEDVIVGYVLTAKECNEPANNPNKIVNGHEITIIDYKKDAFGNLKFICNDTDDDKPEYVEYSADYLLPKIHHAGYPVEIVSNNETEKAA